MAFHLCGRLSSSHQSTFHNALTTLNQKTQQQTRKFSAHHGNEKGKTRVDHSDGEWPTHIYLPLQWGEMDAFGHANNVIYFRWLEICRIHQLAAAGFDLTPDAPISVIVAELGCKYLKPLTWPDTLKVSTRTVSVGNTSWTVEYKIESAKHNWSICSKASGRMVFVNLAAKKKVELPADMKEALMKV
eukprot:TRINITY_DN6794_c0_g1_i1.p1 TRINITY_DN6794_c0_g1~~TRINITY_DN6794_c0_g1_i1.p1  ORF type:complete len:187 (-),score=17.90 TRINITY_DN6794_c0_g1_i1:26-586(-)